MAKTKIGILGAGESGTGAAILAQKKGYEVFVSDSGIIAERYKKKLVGIGVPYEQGKHTEAVMLAAAEVVKSPGIPEDAPLIARLREAGIPVISEVEFANRFTDAQIVGITGSNGKTTTTLLTGHLLKTAGFDVAVGGNVGRSFAANVAEGEGTPYHVLELSSFQLDGIERFRPKVAILLNVSPDHLDRYGYRMENYVASKFRIAMNQRPGDLFIVNGDDPHIGRYRREQGFPSENGPRLLEVSMLFDSKDFLKAGDSVFDMRHCALKGPHNFFNAACAIEAAVALGVGDEAIQRGLSTFRNAPHRLEWVASVRDVWYINDSKATNVDAVIQALRAMERPVVWVAGGTDKGNDYAPLVPLVADKVMALICLGVDNRKLRTAFAGVVPEIAEATTALQAVELASKMARPGEVVLLSPACASFDLFRNYEDRGEQFKEAVRRLGKP